MDTLVYAVRDLNKRFGPGAVVCAASQDDHRVEAISTGVPTLDHALGIGGVPRGRLTEIYGPPGVGKTSLALSIMVQAQQAGEVAAFVDAEHALNWDYALQLGVEPELTLLAQPNSGEEALEVCLGLVQSGKVGVVVLDSIAGLLPRAEKESEVGDRHAGLMAATLSQWLRMLSGPLQKSRTALVVTNQLRMKIGVMFGNPETTCGGQALRYGASVRLDMRNAQVYKVRGQAVGSQVRFVVRKSRVGMPYQQTETTLIYGLGFLEGEPLEAWLTEFRALQDRERAGNGS